MTASIGFGIGYAASQPALRVIEAAQLAERLGYDTFWVTDSHLVSREVLTLLGAVAASTERIGLGTGSRVESPTAHCSARDRTVFPKRFSMCAPARMRPGDRPAARRSCCGPRPRSTTTGKRQEQRCVAQSRAEQ